MEIRSERPLRAAGVALGVASLAAAVSGVAVRAAGGHGWADQLAGNYLNEIAVGASFSVLAGVLTWARPRNPLGWLVQLLGVSGGAFALCQAWAERALFDAPGSLPGGIAMAWIASWVWVLGFIPTFAVLAASYPSGHPRGRLARWLVRLGWVTAALATLGFALDQQAFDDVAPGFAGPFAGAPEAVGLVGLAGIAGGLVTGVIALVRLLVRLGRSTSPEREQLAWFVATWLPAIAGSFLSPWPILTLILTALAPVGIGVGVLRHQLLDIKLVLRRTLLYGLLTAGVVGVYAAALATATALANPRPWAQVLSAGVVAVVVHPGYELLRRGVDRYVYGDRRDPVRALTRLTASLSAEGAGDVPTAPVTGAEPAAAEGVESRVVRSVAEALRVPYAELRPPGGSPVRWSSSGADGVPPGPLHDQELVHAGRVVATLAVGRRTSGEPLSAADLELLHVLAGPAALAMHAAGLAGDLAASRTRALNAVEGERRRLRRDLHDGLGPSLSGVALGLQAARMAAAAGDAGAVAELLARLEEEVTGTVMEVRRLVDGLRPAALEAAGLVEALRAYAAGIARGGLDVEVIAGDLPSLPASVEVTVWRIAGEALANVVRHAGARRCAVALSVTEGPEGHLLLEVADDGVGLHAGSAAEARVGVGLESMRGRAAEIGGECTLAPGPQGGTVVRARLPLAVALAGEAAR